MLGYAAFPDVVSVSTSEGWKQHPAFPDVVSVSSV